MYGTLGTGGTFDRLLAWDFGWAPTLWGGLSGAQVVPTDKDALQACAEPE